MIESREKIQISPKYLFLVGLSGSGKSFLAGIFQEYGTHVISVGPFAKELAEKQGFQIDEQRPWSAVEKLLTRNSSLLGEELREATCKSCEELIIIEGAKSDQDLLPISQNFPTMVYVVTAPREIRLERIRRRKKRENNYKP